MVFPHPPQVLKFSAGAYAIGYLYNAVKTLTSPTPTSIKQVKGTPETNISPDVLTAKQNENKTDKRIMLKRKIKAKKVDSAAAPTPSSRPKNLENDDDDSDE